MSARLAVIVIHGMGSQKAGFAEKVIEELNDRISDAGKDPGFYYMEAGLPGYPLKAIKDDYKKP